MFRMLYNNTIFILLAAFSSFIEVIIMEMVLSVKNQSVETSGITKDYKEALCEFIWNGFEANATEVSITYTTNKYDGVETISVSDNGSGIDFNSLQETFGAFLASNKNALSFRLKSKNNKGKGRFSFTCFSSLAEWHTYFKENDGVIKEYTIKLSDDNKQKIDYSELNTSANHKTGTTVTFYNISSLLSSDLSLESLQSYFLNEFAWFLYLNRHKKIELKVNDQAIEYESLIDTELSETKTIKIDKYEFEISLIVWNNKIKEKYRSYYFDSKDTVKGIDTTSFNRNTVDFSHSVFVKSSYFDERDLFSLFDQTSDLNLFYNQEEQTILKALKKEIQLFIETKIGVFMSSKADQEIKKMIEERKTFPSFPDDDYGELRKKDLINVTKGIYKVEPRIFYKLKEVQEKSLLAFLNLLLSSEERENVLTVIDEIVKLNYTQRKELADILKKTKLENIIESIKFIENRYRIIETLKHIVFELDKYANERDHIQKIIENNYWIFGEQYNLATSDQTLYKSLEEYNYILYGAKDTTAKLSEEEEANRRMDIFLCSSRKDTTSMETQIEENIVVELKAPRIKLNKKVYRQIDDYMDYIRSKPQFNSTYRHWKFIAVCKSVDDYIKSLYSSFKDKNKHGLVHQNDNYEIYAFTWDDVFKSFDLRHSFILDKLKYNKNSLITEIENSYKTKDRDAVDALTQSIID